MLNFILDTISTGFICTTFLLIVAYMVWSPLHTGVRTLLVISNTCLLSIAVLFLICTLLDIDLQLKEIGNDYESYAYLNRLSGPRSYIFWIPVLFRGILPQILWLKKWRRKVRVPFVFMLLMLIAYYLPIYSAENNEYLPSSYTWQFNFTAILFSMVLYAGLMGLLYLIQVKLRRKE